MRSQVMLVSILGQIIPTVGQVDYIQKLLKVILHLCYCFFSSDSNIWFQQLLFSPPAFVPGPVQNLRSSLDTSQPSLTLNWDKPNNIKTTDDVMYDVHFKPFKKKEYHSGRDKGSRKTVWGIPEPVWELSKSEWDHLGTSKPKPARGIHPSSQYADKKSTETFVAGSNAPHHPLLSHTYHSHLPTSHSLPSSTVTCEIQPHIGHSPEQPLTVKAPKTSILLTREYGLNPLTTYNFQVRARIQDAAAEWRTVSACFGKPGITAGPHR